MWWSERRRRIPLLALIPPHFHRSWWTRSARLALDLQPDAAAAVHVQATRSP